MSKILYPFQEIGVEFLKSRKSVLLADQMGLGKTLIAISAAYSENRNIPLVVVCPASVKSVWKSELLDFFSEIDVKELSGLGSFRWPAHGQAFITNYELLPHAAAAEIIDTAAPVVAQTTTTEDAFASLGLCSVKTQKIDFEAIYKNKIKLTKPLPCWGCFSKSDINCSVCNGTKIRPKPHPFTVLIADEVHRAKGKKTLAYKRLKVLAEEVRHNKGKNFLLTATPILNNPEELRTILSVGGLERAVFRNSREFLEGFGGSIQRWPMPHYTFPDGARAAPWVVERLLNVSLRRTREEVLPELPLKTIQDIIVQIKDASPLVELETHLKSEGWDGSLSDLVKIGGLGKISKLRAAIALAKTKAAFEIAFDAISCNEQVVVFSEHVEPVESFKKLGFGVISGDTSMAARSDIILMFQEGKQLDYASTLKLPGIAATIKAGGVGITLTAAALAIFIDLSWTPALNSQAEDRLVRIGQKRPVLIKRLVCDHPIEKRLYDLLSFKIQTFDSAFKR